MSSQKMSPSSHRVKWLKSDLRRVEASVWNKWFGLIPTLRDKFVEHIDDDPLLYNETSSCGLLASSANHAGLLAMNEYISTKRGPGRGRPRRWGRCDLWVYDPKTLRSWSFEIKQKFCLHAHRQDYVRRLLDEACFDAKCVRPQEADKRYGGVIISGPAGLALSRDNEANIVRAAQSATFACRIEGGKAPVWFLLREV